MKTIIFRPLRRIKNTGKVLVASYMQWRKVKTADYSKFNLIVDDEYKGMPLDEYVNADGKHTNTIEGVWSLLKRSISSTHVWVSDTHLPKYLNEFEFRYNNRMADSPMFNIILSNLSLPLCRVDKETGEVITVYQEQRA